MEVPAKFKSALVGLRYSLLAFLIVATSAFLVSCGNTSSFKVTKGPDNLTITLSSDTTHPGEEVTVLVTVIDDNGDPIEGLTVEFSLTQNTSQAFLSALSGLTDFNGQTTITYTAGPTAGGDDKINARVIIRSNGIKLDPDSNATIAVDPTLIGSITVTSGTLTLVANGESSTAVRALLLDVGGTPVSGASVEFTATLGSFVPNQQVTNTNATTNIDGIAEVTLIAGTTPGTATVIANGGGFSGQVTIAFAADVPVTVEVDTMPDSIDPNGETTVTATVKDENGNPIDGETVYFSVEDNESGGELQSIIGLTDTNGQASVTYTAGASTGTDTIKARAATNDVSGTGTVDITAGSIVVGSITVTAGTGTLVADGSSSTVIRATVLDTSNNPAPNILVTFSTTAGGLSPLSDTTDENGIAEVTLTSATNLGTATITANARGFSDTTTVEFIAGGAENITLTADPPNILADGSSTSVISALVTDDDGNPVANGEIITFSITSGGGTLSSLTAVTVNGIATVTFTSPTSGASATIRGETTDGDNASVTIVFTTEQVASITLSLGTTTLVANGVQSTTAVASVTNTDSNPVSDGTPVTFTIPANGGDIDSTTGGAQLTVNIPTTGGIAVAVLTSSTTAGQYIITATSGGVGQLEIYTLVPGPANAGNTTLIANPLVIPADGVSTSLITLSAADSFGNPVVDGTTVNFFTTAGTLSASSGPTANGIATVVLTSSTTFGESATVTAVVDGISPTVAVGFGTVTGGGTGTASVIDLSVSTFTIRVQGSGGQETSVITAIARDETGDFIADCDDNMRFTIANSPGGGVALDGDAVNPVLKSTVNGTASVSLTSGTISGTVTILIEVILDGDCTNGAVFASALTTPIGIEAGEPANIVIFQPTEVIQNSDGSISMIISTLVQDQYGNPVENDTVIFFGLVDNPPTSQFPDRDGYKVAGDVGNTTIGVLNRFESLTFVTGGMDFTDLALNDTLIILEGRDEGGHIINNINSAIRIEVTNDFLGDETLLPFVAGTAELGTVCGVVTTGNLEPDGTCSPSSGTVIKGVAHSRLTWTPQGIFKPFYLYAESVGRTVGDAIGDNYLAVAPVSITVTINPPSVLAGTQDIEVFAEYSDGGSHPISNELITFSTSNALITGFDNTVGTATDSDVTDSAGRATVDDLATQTCLAENATVTITASSGPFAGAATLTIQATAPTANFTCTDAGDSNNADCTDTSTTPAGTTIDTWDWDVNCDSTDSTAQNPTLTLGPGTTLVCLTVTNDAGCSSSTSQSITIGAGAPMASFTDADQGDGTVDFTDTSAAATGTTNDTWNWTFPAGAVPAASSAQDPAGVDFGVIGPGPHSVTLTVTNDFGVSDSVTQSVSVSATPVAASFAPSDNGDGTADFFDTSTTPGTSSITSWMWTFPAGTIPGVSTAQNPTNIDFSGSDNDGTGGQFDVTLLVTNNFGTSDTASNVNVNITAASPSASFTSTDNADGTADFTDTSTASESTITGWDWTFPTGTTNPGISSTDQHPTGVDFSGSDNDGTGGQFNVSLQVTDNFGNTDSVTDQDVNLTAAAPSISSLSFSFAVNCQVTFNDFTTPGDSTKVSWDWTFSSAEPGVAPLSASFASSGNPVVVVDATPNANFTINWLLDVTDNFGNSDSSSNTTASITCP